MSKKDKPKRATGKGEQKKKISDESATTSQPQASPKDNARKPITTVGGDRTPNELIDDILARARRGDITPEQAERESRGHGMGALAVEPAFKKHNPLNKPTWTMPMVLSWIVTRDAETVQWHDDFFRMEVLEWLKRGSGYELVQPRPMTMVIAEMGLEGDATVDPDPSVRHQRVRDAKEDLWLALAAGEIQATAVHGADGPVILIEQVEWHHLRPFQTLNADYLSYEHGPGGVAYTRVKFLRPQIVKRWPVSAVTEGKPESPVATPRNPGGRPRAYNWDEVMHECVRLANLPDGLPERPQLVEHLQHWFLDRYESEPAVSVIYERIAPLYKHVGDNRKSSK